MLSLDFGGKFRYCRRGSEINLVKRHTLFFVLLDTEVRDGCWKC
jgi:hypothetical protein